MTRTIALIAATASLLFPTSAIAHDHYVVTGNGRIVVLAGGNGTHNVPPTLNDDMNWEICGGDPAWYGLEVAHHGADAGEPGNSDGCYAVPGGYTPGNPLADRNPAIQ